MTRSEMVIRIRTSHSWHVVASSRLGWIEARWGYSESRVNICRSNLSITQVRIRELLGTISQLKKDKDSESWLSDKGAIQAPFTLYKLFI